MKRPLVLATAVVALAISLFALGLGLRDPAPSTHAQAVATATAAPAGTTATATPATTATAAPVATATTAPAATPTASPTTTTTTTITTGCTATTLGEPRRATGATTDTGLAKDCDTLLALRDKLPQATADNWLNWSRTLPLTSTNTDGTIAQNWDGVTVGTDASGNKRVTELRLTGEQAPYSFRGVVAELANLDALVALHIDVYETPTTPETTGTALPSIPCATQANTALQTDCDTLLTIKSTLAGTGALNWGDPTTAFTSTSTTAAGAVAVSSGWDGVTVGTVDGKLRVTKLELPGKSLTGTIPWQIGNLTALANLNLRGNNLSGAIPWQIGDLTALTHLNLQNNRLGGGIPTQIGDLTALTSLILDASGNQYNTFTGTIPTQLGKLTNLQVLKLHDPNHGLHGGLPPQLGNLSQLTTLSIRFADLGGSIPPELGNLTNLKGLALIGLGLTGTIPPELGNLTNLGNLRLKGNSQLTGPLPTQLGTLTKLNFLELDRTGVCVPAGLDLATVRTAPTPPPACSTGN